MQIVIEIDDDDYQFIQDTEFENYVVTQHLYEAVYEGTPLPKGHGDLIDRDFVRDVFIDAEMRKDYEYLGLDDEPTIIEAESEE